MSPSILDSTPHAVAATLVLGGVLVASSYIYFVSASSKSSTSTGTSMPGWVQHMIDLFVSFLNKKYNAQKPLSTAVMVPPQEQRITATCGSQSYSEFKATIDAALALSPELRKYDKRISKNEEAISSLELCQAGHSRSISIHGVLLNDYHDKHKVAEKRQDTTEEEVKKLWASFEGMMQNIKDLGTSVIIVVVLVSCVAIRLTR